MPVPKAMPSPEGPETGEGSGVQPDTPAKESGVQPGTPAKKKSMSNALPKKQLSMYDIFGKAPPCRREVRHQAVPVGLRRKAPWSFASRRMAARAQEASKMEASVKATRSFW